jgi:actin-related protein
MMVSHASYIQPVPPYLILPLQGTGTIKAGFAGADEPKLVFPTQYAQ